MNNQYTVRDAENTQFITDGRIIAAGTLDEITRWSERFGFRIDLDDLQNCFGCIHHESGRWEIDPVC